MLKNKKIHTYLEDNITTLMRKDFTVFNENINIGKALEMIRQEGIGERIIYFYISDDEGKLKGIIPTRKLLLNSPETILKDIMIRKIIYLPESSRVFDAIEFFILYKFLAIPIVDEDKKLIGIIDVTTFTEEIVNVPEIEGFDEVFETLGFKYEQIKHANPFKSFRYRVPWFFATVISGTIGALLVNVYEVTIAQSIVIAFFLALILGLGESISIQTMTITIQALRFTKPTMKWFIQSMLKEIYTSSMIGGLMGLIVGLIVLIFYNETTTAIIIGLSILLSNITSSIIGLSVPSILHYFKLDPKIASGPATLALSDLFTLIIYFNVAMILFR